MVAMLAAFVIAEDEEESEDDEDEDDDPLVPVAAGVAVAIPWTPPVTGPPLVCCVVDI